MLQYLFLFMIILDGLDFQFAPFLGPDGLQGSLGYEVCPARPSSHFLNEP
jgi:hypothetical protein